MTDAASRGGRQNSSSSPSGSASFSRTTWGRVLLRMLRKTRTPLSRYIGALLDAQSELASLLPCESLWPCPLPYRRDVAPRPASRRQQKRFEWALSRRTIVNAVVAALSHSQGRCSPWPPASIRGRRPLSAVQWEHVQRLEAFVTRWGRVEVSTLDCGRKGTALKDMVDTLASFAARAGATTGFYSQTGLRVSGMGPRGFKPVLAERFRFPADLGFFDAQPHLSPYLWMPFVEPACLRGVLAREPRHKWAKFKGDFKEVLKVFEVWARAGRFGTRPAARGRYEERGGGQADHRRARPERDGGLLGRWPRAASPFGLASAGRSFGAW